MGVDLTLLPDAEACDGACFLRDEGEGEEQVLSLLAKASTYLRHRVTPEAHAGHEHLPLCAPEVVSQACSSLSQHDHARHSTHMTKQEFSDAVSANLSVADVAWKELGYGHSDAEVPCMEVCKEAVRQVSKFAHMPSQSDMGCYKGKGGLPVCDLDLSAKAIGALAMEGRGASSTALAQSADKAAKGPALAATGRRIAGEPFTAEAVPVAVPYTRKRILLKLVNLFHVYPLEKETSSRRPKVVHLNQQQSMGEHDVENQQRLLQARTFLQYTTAAFVQGGSIVKTQFAKYFGASTWDNSMLQQEVLRMLNQMQEIFNDADLIYPGAKCDDLLGAGGAAAYATPGAVDAHGHTAILYLCNPYYKDNELEQVGTLIHELSHQELVGEDDFCRDKSAQWTTIWSSDLPSTGWRSVNGQMAETDTTYLNSMWKYDGCSGWWWVRYNGQENGKNTVILECDPQKVHNCQTQSYGQEMAELLAQQDILAAVRSANNFERFVKDCGHALWQ